MSGRRSFAKAEFEALYNFCHKNKDFRLSTLLVMGRRTGFRIAELLSLTTSDVFWNGGIRDRVTVERKHMKGKKRSRTVPLHPEIKRELEYFLSNTEIDTDKPLFASRKGGPITPRHAWHLIKKACEAVGIDPSYIGTHSMRKTFAVEIHEKLDKNILKTQKAMGHAKIDSTVQYLPTLDEDIDDAMRR